MRLIDADAEIKKIENEIEQYEKRITQWESRRNDCSYDIDQIIEGIKENIKHAKLEIMTLNQYDTLVLPERMKLCDICELLENKCTVSVSQGSTAECER